MQRRAQGRRGHWPKGHKGGAGFLAHGKSIVAELANVLADLIALGVGQRAGTEEIEDGRSVADFRLLEQLLVIRRGVGHVGHGERGPQQAGERQQAERPAHGSCPRSGGVQRAPAGLPAPSA